MDNRLLWHILKNAIESRSDVVIQSELHLLPYIIGEQRQISFIDGGEGRYYKGIHFEKIDFVINSIDKCALTYGTDFNRKVFSKLLKKQ